MSKRTSIPEILARFWVVAFFFGLFPYGLVAVLGGAISLSFLAFIAFAAVLLFNGLQWVGHWAIFGRTEAYREFRKSGGDPWFHLSWPTLSPRSLRCFAKVVANRFRWAILEASARAIQAFRWTAPTRLFGCSKTGASPP